MEKRISVLSQKRCYHLDVVLLANAQLDHEHIQSLWSYSEEEYRPVRPYSDAVAAHADHLRTTLSAKGMNEYVKGGEKLGQQGGVKLDQREIFEEDALREEMASGAEACAAGRQRV
jgi:hypothetical protein